MGTEAEREGIRAAIRALLRADGGRGARGDLAHYQGLFPGYWDVVAEEFSGEPPAEPPGEPAAPAGERIGPYRVVRELGRGGMGVVCLAEDTRLPRRVALKVLPPHFAASPQMLARFRRESALASKLDHPHICTVFEAGEADGTAYMAMRYVEGETLSALVGRSRDPHRPSGVVGLPAPEPVPPPPATEAEAKRVEVDRVLLLLEKAARALHAAHEKGLVHRDIKPHNIMVTGAGEPVLLDFGLAREQDDEGHGLTQTGSLMGTPAYMSPEQLTAQRIALDRRTDVYSLGVTLYECLTLRLPFESPTLDGLYQKILATEPEDPRRLNRAVSRDLRVVVATAMERDRARRYQTALDLAEDLRRVRTKEPIRARPVGAALRLWRWVQRNPPLAASILGLFLVLAAGLAATTSLWREAEAGKSATAGLLERVRSSLQVQALALKEMRNPPPPSGVRLVPRAIARNLSDLNVRYLRPSFAPGGEFFLAYRSEEVRRPLGAFGTSGSVMKEIWTAELLSLDGDLIQEAQATERAQWETARTSLPDRIAVGDATFLQVGDDGVARVNRRGNGVEIISVRDSGGVGFQAGCFDAQGRLILCNGKEVVLLSPEGKELRRFAATADPVAARIEPAPVGEAVTLGARRVLDLASGKQWVAPPRAVLEWIPGTDRLLEVERGGYAGQATGFRILNVDGTAQGAVSLSAAGSPRAREVAPLASGDGVMVAFQDGVIRTWDLLGKPQGSLPARIYEWVDPPGTTAFASSPKGDLVATFNHRDGAYLAIWARSGERLAKVPWTETPQSAFFSPSGEQLLVATRSGSVWLWEVIRTPPEGKR